MKRKITFALLLIVGCASLKSTRSTTVQKKSINLTRDDSAFYKIYKIDSINSYYLIYAKKGDSLFKIVSKKESTSNCKRIKVDSIYNLLLTSIWNNKVFIGGVDVSPGSTPHVNCVSFDKLTLICLEKDSINDLHVARNVKGLCFVKQ